MADKDKRLQLWKVHHPDHCMAPVVAENVEQATAKAAQLWGVPWRKVAFFCTVEPQGDINPHICPRCRRHNAYYEQEYCPKCTAELQHEEERVQAAKQAYFRREARKAKGETG